MTAQPLAIVTPSYAGDFARCQLLCESIDALVEGPWRHYVLVADHDEALFKPLRSQNRIVIPDSALLPRWLKAVRRPFDAKGRHIWISTDLRRQIRPLSGWHVQQLRKLAVARIATENLLVMADSDSVFVRPFGSGRFLQDDDVRLYRKPGAIRTDEPGAGDHPLWTRHAAKVLGLPPPAFPADDYINNLVSWRRDHALALVARIESIGGAPVEMTLGRATTLSEYQIYGSYVAGPGGMGGHFASPDALSHTYWVGDALTQERLDAFVADLKPHQVALCIQSFTDTPLELLQGLFRSSQRAAARM